MEQNHVRVLEQVLEKEGFKPKIVTEFVFLDLKKKFFCL